MGLAQVVDTRDETLGAGYRGNGVGLPALAPGAHTYAARVNFGAFFPEASTANNRFTGTQTVTVPAGDCR